MCRIAELRTHIFADGADLRGMLELARRPYVEGFTTNPTLMHKAGIRDYRGFARAVVAAIPDRPVSFEVFSDDFDGMERQALEIASWGENVFVKIPVSDTRGRRTSGVVRRLAEAGVKLNVTALMTLEQVRDVSAALGDGAPAFLSIFAGRIADTGRDPVPIIVEALETIARHPNQGLIWASPRELLNVFQADAVGCHVITLSYDLLQKLALVDRDLVAYSLDTVRMFHDDAVAAGFAL
jgi:transaldolase